MTTRRRPLARPAAPKITPAALEAFAELRQLGCTCRGLGECPECRRRNELERVIHRALGLRPWHGTVEPPSSVCPYPAGTRRRAQLARSAG